MNVQLDLFHILSLLLAHHDGKPLTALQSQWCAILGFIMNSFRKLQFPVSLRVYSNPVLPQRLKFSVGGFTWPLWFQIGQLMSKQSEELCMAPHCRWEQSKAGGQSYCEAETLKITSLWFYLLKAFEVPLLRWKPPVCGRRTRSGELQVGDVAPWVKVQRCDSTGSNKYCVVERSQKMRVNLL